MRGIEIAGVSMTCRDQWFNPKGIASFSPRLARLREGLPWVIAGKPHNPEKVVYQNSRRTGSTLSADSCNRAQDKFLRFLRLLGVKGLRACAFQES